jgi:hypothetical protein
MRLESTTVVWAVLTAASTVLDRRPFMGSMATDHVASAVQNDPARDEARRSATVMVTRTRTLQINGAVANGRSAMLPEAKAALTEKDVEEGGGKSRIAFPHLFVEGALRFSGEEEPEGVEGDGVGHNSCRST